MPPLDPAVDTRAPPASDAPADEAVNILIVDDEPKNLTVLETVLNEPGYRLVRANSGEEALLALVSTEFALLVLDVRMPGMSGFELAQMVKQRRKTANVPIIFLTAYYNEDQHVLTGYGMGAVDYLHKPINSTVLRSKVAVFAELHRKSRALEQVNSALQAEVAEHAAAELRLSELAGTLERRVHERTSELAASDALLRAAHRRKDEFLATLAHELRNPLAPVRQAAQLLRRQGGDSPELQWATAVIERQVRAMTRLVDDLMDVTRIDQGKIALRRERLELAEVLADAQETMRPVLEEYGHTLAVSVPANGLPVHADRTRLAQAFTNLLHNAAKYSNRGGRIQVDAAVDRNLVRVSVRDDGIGIAADRLESVFELFSQVEPALERSQGGLGIGLALTRQLVQLHGGTVVALSDGPGRGSEFRVCLPLELETGTAQAGAPSGVAPQPAPGPGLAAARDGLADRASTAAPSRRLRVLVADDNQDAADSLGMLLESMGHDVRRAADGIMAVAAFEAFGPHVVLMDIGMPKLNGYEACQRMRATSFGSRVTIVAVSGWAQPEDRRRSSEAGFDRHLVKPLDSNTLLALLDDAALASG